MNPRRGGRFALSGSPVLVGAVTMIVALVAVFLSYNANEGLPFVPTYDLTAEVPSANGLVRGNEVRMGGNRVGVVTSIESATQENGVANAHLKLSLDERVTPLPVDSKLIIRPRSALGLMYVEITRGKSRRGFTEGEAIPPAASKTETVEIDEFFNTFDDPTRAGTRTNMAEYGAAFAGRGPSLNEAFAALAPLARKLEPAMRNLASPKTALDKLFPAFEQAAAEAAPVANEQAALWVALDTTFTAWSGVSDSLKATIRGGPAALDTATAELPRQRPFMRESEELFRRFRPAFANLAAAAPSLAAGFRYGTPALLRQPPLTRRLTRTLETLERFGNDDRVPSGLARLTRTVVAARPLLSHLTPAQTVCNYGSLFFRNFASATSESDVIGSFLRVATLALPQVPGSEAGPSAVPANGPKADPKLTSIEKSLVNDSFLHSNPYPNTAAPGQPRECEAGNESYTPDQQVIGNTGGAVSTRTEKTTRQVSP